VGYNIVSLGDLMEQRSGQMVDEILLGFSCSKDEDVQRYIRKTAVKHELAQISRTYLIFDTEPTERLVAYITLAVRCLNVGDERLNEDLSERMNFNNGTAQSYLIGQLGKVDGYGKNIGDYAMVFASGIIRRANLLVGCRTIRLDCKDALVGYYEKKGFDLLSRDAKKGLNRMVKILS